jgi:hypothetical protein
VLTVQREIAERLAETLEASYVDARAGARMAEHLRSRIGSGAFDAIPSDQRLADAFTAELRTIVSDPHLGVGFDPAKLSASPAAAPSGPPPQPSAEVLDAMRAECTEIVTAAVLNPRIGQLKIDGFLPPEACTDVFAAAFQQVSDTHALIIDLRESALGGESNGVALLLSYLVDPPPRQVITIEFRSGERVGTMTRDVGALAYGADRPVFVLTSGRTFSAGEELAYDIQALGRGLIVGEVTGGGANPGGVAILGHGFEVFVPVGRAVNAITGTNWEGVGVQPDVAVAASEALMEAMARAGAP